MTSGKVPGFDDVRGEGMSGACAERVRSGASKEIEMLSEASEVGAARRRSGACSKQSEQRDRDFERSVCEEIEM